MSDASILILNFNGKDLLPACLDSVEAQVPADSGSEIIVVDNGSTDGSAAWVREHRPRVRLIETGANLGFAGGNNRGVEAARNDLVILLNNDAVVEPGWFEALVAFMRDHPDVAVASGQVITAGVPARFYEMNGSVSLSGHNVMRVFRDLGTLFYANGCSLIFRRDVLGLPFDPQYFCYGEDAYLSLRARFMGRGVRQVTAARVLHLGGVTSRRTGNARMVFYQERNRLLNFAVFFSFGFRARIAPYVVVSAIGRFATHLPTRPASAWHMARGHLWLLANGREIARMRATVREEQTVAEAEVVRFMSGKIVNGDGATGRFLNLLSLIYCRLAGIRVYELCGDGRG